MKYFKKIVWIAVISVSIFITVRGSNYLEIPGGEPKLKGGQPETILPVHVLERKLSDKILLLNIKEDRGKNNVIAIRSPKGVVVIDSTLSSGFSALIRNTIEKHFAGVPVTHLINTHYHGDHTWGNQVFKDCLILGHQCCLDQMSQTEKLKKQCLRQIESLNRVIKIWSEKIKILPDDSDEKHRLKEKVSYYQFMKEGFLEFEPHPPNLTFTDHLSLDLGGLTLHLIYYGPSHSDSDIIVFCPEEKVLLTGDLFVPEMNPPLDSERVKHINRWINTMDWLQSQRDNLELIIPGHGDLITKKDFLAKYHFLKDQQKAVSGKSSAFKVFKQVKEARGLGRAIQRYRKLFKRKRSKYYFLETDLIGLGYTFLGEQQIDSAIKVFKLAVEVFSNSFNTWDSLAEAQSINGQISEAIKNYKQSYKLNSKNTGAIRKIEDLQKKLKVGKPVNSPMENK